MGDLFTGELIGLLAGFTILAVLAYALIQAFGIRRKRDKLHETHEEHLTGTGTRTDPMQAHVNAEDVPESGVRRSERAEQQRARTAQAHPTPDDKARMVEANQPRRR